MKSDILNKRSSTLYMAAGLLSILTGSLFLTIAYVWGDYSALYGVGFSFFGFVFVWLFFARKFRKSLHS